MAAVGLGALAGFLFLLSLVVPWFTTTPAHETPTQQGPEAILFAPHVLVLAPFLVWPLRWRLPGAPVAWAVASAAPGVALAVASGEALDALLFEHDVVVRDGRWLLVGAVVAVGLSLAALTVARPRATPADPLVVARRTAAWAGAAGVLTAFGLPVVGVRRSPDDAFLDVVRGWHLPLVGWAVIGAGVVLVAAATVAPARTSLVVGAVAAVVVGAGGVIVAGAAWREMGEVGLRSGGVLLGVSVAVLLAAALAPPGRRPAALSPPAEAWTG